MIIQDIILILFAGICLWAGVLTRYKWAYFLPVPAAVLHILWSNTNWFMYVTYVSAVIIAALYLARKKRGLTIALSVFITLFNMVLLFMPTIMTSKCYSSLSYTKAFEQLHQDIKEEYALAEYKGTDLDALYSKYLPIIAGAQRDKDKEAYLNALVDYTNEFHDGHISVSDMLEFFGIGSLEELSEAKKTRFTSCYSMALLKLDDGRYIAVHVLEEGAAYAAGIREGDEIISWDGKTVPQALTQIEELVPVRAWMFADEENRERYRTFYLPCMSGESVDVEYRNAEGVLCRSHMNSEGNGYEYLRSTINLWSNRVNGGSLSSTLSQSITYENREGYYYININGFGGTREDIEGVMDEIVRDMEKTAVTNILLDVRNNSGGDDELGALAVSYFASEDMLYLKEGHYDTKLQSYVADREINVQARGELTAPVTLLVNSQCISAGEGFVYNMSRLPQVTVVGMSGTNGSFGTFSGIHIMPEQVLVTFPSIACMDENGEIMIDSDRTQIGGIKPDRYIPVDENAAKVLFTTDRDYELEYAVGLME